MEEYSELEKKIYDALIDGKINEVSEQVQSIEEVLSKSRAYTVSLPNSNEFLERYQKLNEQKIIKINWARTMNKKIIYVLGAAAVILIGLFLGLSGDKSKGNVATKEMKAKVTFVVGNVILKTSESDSGEKLIVGTLISANQILETGNKSSADLEFSHGSSLRIKANSKLVMKSLIESEESITEEISLKRGLVVADVKKKKQSDNFNIVTPTVIAGVRGTRFLVEVKENQSNGNSISRVSVLDGSVGVTKHKNDVPLTSEPFEILDSNESGAELTGGEFKKDSISNSDVKIIEGRADENDDTEITTSAPAETEKSLFDKYGRLEIISLDGGKSITGVITGMDEKALTVHTVNGFIKVDRKKVISSDAKKVK